VFKLSQECLTWLVLSSILLLEEVVCNHTTNKEMLMQPADDRNKPEQQILAELVSRIIHAVQPQRIILFGSAARGQLGPNSDLDVLVVMPDGIHRRRTEQTIYRNLKGLGWAKDIIVVTESDIRDYGDNPSLVLYSALQEGKELYRAAG
jgi:predicted nucleotidyltransferase